MDLLATVRKEGSRGGRGEVDWSAVQNSSHREHYLGHSLHAPVGRWAKGRDLQWYARADSDDADGEDPAAKAARERKEEIRRVKEAEEDALARALGLPVPDRNNANLQPVSDKREVDKVLNEVTGMDEGVGKGIGYGSHAASGQAVMGERIEGDRIAIEEIEVEAETANIDITTDGRKTYRAIGATIDLGRKGESVQGTDTETGHAIAGRNTVRDQEVQSTDLREGYGDARDLDHAESCYLTDVLCFEEEGKRYDLSHASVRT